MLPWRTAAAIEWPGGTPEGRRLAHAVQSASAASAACVVAYEELGTAACRWGAVGIGHDGASPSWGLGGNRRSEGCTAVAGQDTGPPLRLIVLDVFVMVSFGLLCRGLADAVQATYGDEKQRFQGVRGGLLRITIAGGWFWKCNEAVRFKGLTNNSTELTGLSTTGRRRR